MIERHSIAGSAIGGIRGTQEMPDFCAECVLASKVRYRFIVDTATLV